MKKYLLSALALPLLFACSSEDYMDQKATDNDQFAGIEKVDATFSMANDPSMRMKSDWELEEGDQYGFAWLGGGEATSLAINGKAWQNHPLTQTGEIFKPQTSIYVGKYFLYRPYDETVVNIDEINFKSLEEQTIVDGKSTGWAPLAKNAIIIGDKWTDVKKNGTTIGGETWNQAGINHQFKIYAAIFSNQTGLDLKYEKNNVEFDGTKTISGATDIEFTPTKGTKVGAADIYGGTVKLDGAAKSFTYAPGDADKEPVKVAHVDGEEHSGTFWADKKDVATSYGFKFLPGTDPDYDVITLKVDKKTYENGISTDNAKNKGWFWFNSLPVTTGNATKDTPVKTVLETSYGIVTINSTVGECAWANESYDGTSDFEWIKLSDATSDAATPKTWDVSSKNTFVNQYGNHAGKFKLDVDFSTGVMNGMHIKNDAHLQKALKYYIASGKGETGVVLNLDKDADDEFKISKLSIALLQTIGGNVKVQACTEAEETPKKIIVTQDGQTTENGLANKTEVPALNNVFAVLTDVYLAAKNSDGAAIAWTWAGGGKTAGWDDALTIDDKVKSITNEGTLTVNAVNVQLSETTSTLKNAAGATMNITKVTTVKNALTNLGTINVGSAENKAAELRAYAVAIDNDATGLEKGKYGVINNYGVVGVTDGTPGKFNNYGLIDMKDKDAITLLSTNEKTTDFDDAFNASTNKMGTVKLPNNNPLAIVSVANKDANGFIRYTWPADQTTYVTPAGNVKYNTIVVSGNIEFTEKETEIQYIAFTGVRTQVINPGGYLSSLKGIMVDNDNHNASIIIEKGNMLNPKNGTFLGTGATVYYGGQFTHNAKTVSGTTVSNYFGEWSTDQIVKY